MTGMKREKKKKKANETNEKETITIITTYVYGAYIHTHPAIIKMRERD